MFRLYKSPEGVKEYEKLGMKFPEHLHDQLFSNFQRLVAADKNKTERITEIKRVKLNDGTEWLVYASTSEGKDIYGKKHQFQRSNLGKFLQLNVETTMTPNPNFTGNSVDFTPEGEVKDVSDNLKPYNETVQIIGDHEAYSIKFTKENLEKLHAKCNDTGAKETTSYIVARENGASVTVTSGYKDFLGDFETLYNYSKIVSDAERDRLDAIRFGRINTPAIAAKPMEVLA